MAIREGDFDFAAKAGTIESSRGNANAVPTPLKKMRLGRCFFITRFIALLLRRFAFGTACYSRSPSPEPRSDSRPRPPALRYALPLAHRIVPGRGPEQTLTGSRSDDG